MAVGRSSIEPQRRSLLLSPLPPTPPEMAPVPSAHFIAMALPPDQIERSADSVPAVPTLGRRLAVPLLVGLLWRFRTKPLPHLPSSL